METYAAGGLPLYAAGLQATSLMVMGMLVALALARCIPEPEPTALVAGGGRVGEIAERTHLSRPAMRGLIQMLAHAKRIMEALPDRSGEEE